jgi:hypothetical protein
MRKLTHMGMHHGDSYEYNSTVSTATFIIYIVRWEDNREWDMEGGVSDLLYGNNILYFLVTMRKDIVRKASIMAQVRTGYLPNTLLELCRYTKLNDEQRSVSIFSDRTDVSYMKYIH